ncbi:Alt RNA polymerase ADP-ribosylase [Aeromonas phage Aeh1]|uniref:Alt RNA polymerase ADP-ribosylase n=1 Tax=Aeromonas phage Aeh1 TaxID=2880362 RepID=Q76YI5_9CAUD|nr:Alt-like RNA polymerase ADP-ribosyltransferase [Aeromonas phage Aeh1]AAQ17910.1 Alt RNA polymerase ADP-ribosylase [Aeromonas phage Aeh1]
MSIKEMLMTEASPVPYTSTKTNKNSLSDDLWTFSVGPKTLGVKANSMRPTGLATYKKSALPSVFHMFEIESSGKTTRNIKTIPKPLNAIATVAEIIANETHENKMNDVVIFRVPSSMGKAESVSAIVSRYVKKSGVPFEPKGVINVGEKGFNYIFITRKGKNPTVAQVFGIKDDEVVTLADLSAHEATVEKIVAKIEPMIKRQVPSMIKVSEIVGGSDVPAPAASFIKDNPPVLGNIDVKKKTEFKVADLFAKYELDSSNVFMSSTNPTGDRPAKTSNIAGIISMNSMADSVEAKQFATQIGEMNITMKDFVENSDKMASLKKFIEDEITANATEVENIIQSVFTHGIVESISDKITGAYASFRPTYIAKEDANIIDRYCGSGYSQINNQLIHGIISGNATEWIKKLDEAFDRSGVRVNPELTVYRGSKLPSSEVFDITVGKLFHFRAFVSTSLNPRTGFSFGGNDKHDIARVLTNTQRRDKIDDTEPMQDPMTAAFMISGLDKIPVIIPGTYSPYERECEVVLPRGTTIRIEDMATANLNKFTKTLTNILFVCKGVAPSEVSINEVIYDGDEFMNTGRLVEFSQFSDREIELTEAKKKADKADSKIKAAMLFTAAVNSESFTKQMSKKEKEEMKRIADKYCGSIM